jgi:hypothetical protein
MSKAKKWNGTGLSIKEYIKVQALSSEQETPLRILFRRGEDSFLDGCISEGSKLKRIVNMDELPLHSFELTVIGRDYYWQVTIFEGLAFDEREDVKYLIYHQQPGLYHFLACKSNLKMKNLFQEFFNQNLTHQIDAFVGYQNAVVPVLRNEFLESLGIKPTELTTPKTTNKKQNGNS